MELDDVDDATLAAAFRRLARHLRHRKDAQNVDLMGLAGFCRNCLGDWIAEASGGRLDKETGRHAVYGMPHAAWKANHQGEASPDQIARMNASLARNRTLDEALDESFPASDPPSMTEPAAKG